MREESILEPLNLACLKPLHYFEFPGNYSLAYIRGGKDDACSEDHQADEIGKMEDELIELAKEGTPEPKTIESTPQPTVRKHEKNEGRIPFMNAALRDYAIGKPSFENIEDKKVRRLIKRMRAEDIGRIAVLKNLNNQEIGAAGNEKTLKTIRENVRNQEVLANVPERVGREEYVRQPFNKNDLKQRKDVYYKLAFHIMTTGVSETIEDAMDTEISATFFMPEFDLQSGHFITVADARTGYYEYRNRGFKDVQIVSYLNDAQIALTDVEKIPFIE